MRSRFMVSQYAQNVADRHRSDRRTDAGVQQGWSVRSSTHRRLADVCSLASSVSRLARFYTATASPPPPPGGATADHVDRN